MTAPKKPKAITANQVRTQQIRTMRANEMASMSRADFFNQMGMTFGGKRNTYKVLGYPTKITYNNFYDMWKRNGIAKRVVKAFPEATWRGVPTLTVPKVKNSESDFVQEWNKIVTDSKVYHYLQRVDILSGIGQFGVLLIGFDDGGELEDEVTEASAINFLAPYAQGAVKVHSYVADTKNRRFGKPEFYMIQMLGSITEGVTEQTNVTKKVHWSRILHVAEEKEENEVLGTPRLESVYNYILNLDKVSGGSAEMFWLGAYNGIVAEADKDAEIDDVDALNDEIENFANNMKRYTVVQGMKVKSLAPGISPPWEALNSQLTLISGSKGIPRRLLMGSERGELASIMDENNWNTRVDERRLDFAEVQILREFVDRLISVNVLPAVEKYAVVWPTLESNDAKRRSEVILNISEAIGEYMTSQSYMLMPLDMYLTLVFGLTDEEIQELRSNYPKAFQIEDEDLQALLDEQAAAEEDANVSPTPDDESAEEE